MNTSSSTDKVMNEMNDLAKAQGRYLGKAFWEIPSLTESILDVPSTPESEQRLAALRARRLQKKEKAAEQTEAGATLKDAEKEHVHGTKKEEVPAAQGGPD
jgi:hypothetical protein